MLYCLRMLAAEPCAMARLPVSAGSAPGRPPRGCLKRDIGRLVNGGTARCRACLSLMPRKMATLPSVRAHVVLAAHDLVAGDQPAADQPRTTPSSSSMTGNPRRRRGGSGSQSPGPLGGRTDADRPEALVAGPAGLVSTAGAAARGGRPVARSRPARGRGLARRPVPQHGHGLVAVQLRAAEGLCLLVPTLATAPANTAGVVVGARLAAVGIDHVSDDAGDVVGPPPLIASSMSWSTT